MLITTTTLPELGAMLLAARKEQGLSRAQAAAVCDVSESFIRDVESDPGRCLLSKIARYTQGLGLTLAVSSGYARTSVAMLPMTAHGSAP